MTTSNDWYMKKIYFCHHCIRTKFLVQEVYPRPVQFPLTTRCICGKQMYPRVKRSA